MNLLSEGNKMKEGAILGVMFIALVIVFGILLAIPIMLLWNYCLVGVVAGVSEITLLQAWGLYILSNFLFKTSVTKAN
jgi:uncharacterized membrane protein YdfJ with MMPL/SSD domain